MNVSKYCSENAFDNGCIPHYDGIDTISKNKKPDSTDAEIMQSTSGMSGWRTKGIKESKAIVTTDGMIFVGNFTRPNFLVDVNGQKGPNKLGHDVIMLRGYVKNQYSQVIFNPYNDSRFIDKGGKTPQKLMYNKK